MASSSPFFSIVTAVYNNAAGLERTIRSLMDQNYTDFEYIVIDGGSNDGTQAVIAKYADFITYHVSERDAGIYDAWNKGLNRARGQWISFLGSGDIYYPEALTKYHQYISNNPTLEYVSSRVNLTSDNRIVRTIGRPWHWPAFLKIMTVAHVGSMHHRDLYRKYGSYDDTYKITGDYEFLLRAGDTLSAGYFDAITCEMAMGGISTNWRRVFKETLRAKVETGRKQRWKANIEDLEAKCKYFVRSVIK